MRAGAIVGGTFRLEAPLHPSDPASWRAADRTSGRAVLVCLVPREVAAAAQKWRAVQHPALVPVLDVRSADDEVASFGPDPRAHAFVILEAPAETLAERVKTGGKLTLRAAVRLCVAIGDGLAALHAEGCLHAGVGPNAIELSSDGASPRLGLRGARADDFAYASPERIADGALSRRDDAWGLVATLYFAVSGAPPFAGESAKELTQAVLRGGPPPFEAKTRADAALARVFARGFARVPSQRHADVAALCSELRVWLVLYDLDDDDADEGVTAIASMAELLGADAPSDLATTNEVPVAASVLGRGGDAPSPPSERTWTLSPEALSALAEEHDRNGAVHASVPATPLAHAEEGLDPITALDVRPRPSSAPAPTAAPADGAYAAPPPLPSPTGGDPAPAAAPAALPPRPLSTARRSALVAFGALSLLALGAVVWATSRAARPAPPAAAVSVTTMPVGHPPAGSADASAAPVHAASVGSVPAASVPGGPAPAAAGSGAPARGGGAPIAPGTDVTACVAAWFPEDAFARGADLAFVCDDANARSGGKKLKRAIVAGGVGRGVTAAMQEMSRYHWFELPVYAALRAQCCANATVETPSSTKCASPAGVVAALAAATSAHAPLDAPIATYKKTIACLVAHGEQSLYGETDGVRGGEERAFRSFAARGMRLTPAVNGLWRNAVHVSARAPYSAQSLRVRSGARRATPPEVSGRPRQGDTPTG